MAPRGTHCRRHRPDPVGGDQTAVTAPRPNPTIQDTAMMAAIGRRRGGAAYTGLVGRGGLADLGGNMGSGASLRE